MRHTTCLCADRVFVLTKTLLQVTGQRVGAHAIYLHVFAIVCGQTWSSRCGTGCLLLRLAIGKIITCATVFAVHDVEGCVISMSCVALDGLGEVSDRQG